MQLSITQATRCNLMVANYVLFTFHISSTPIWRLRYLASRESSIVIRFEEYNLYRPGFMCFHLVPQLPKLVTIVANFL